MQVGLTLSPGRVMRRTEWSWFSVILWRSGPECQDLVNGAMVLLLTCSQAQVKAESFMSLWLQHGLQWFMGRCNPHSSTGCRLRYVPQFSSSVCSFYAKDSWWTFTLYPKSLCRPCIYLVTKWLLSTPSQERKDPKCDCELPSPPGPMHGSVLASL